MRFVPTALFALFIACGDASGPVPIADFVVNASLATAPMTLVTESGRWDGCQAAWTFTANDSRPTIYYSVGPGRTAAATEWWENGNFRAHSAAVSLFVPAGRSIAYALWRVQGTTEIWRKESGSLQISC